MFRNIIYFAHFLGQSKLGVEKTPDLLYNYIHTDKYNFFVKTNNNNFIYNINNLYTKNKNIYESKINIGGDHSMAIATVSDSLNKYPDTKVLWFDAHPDINTYDESESKNFHGMPLAYLTGLDNNVNFPFIKNKLKFKNLLYIGIRDIDPFEKKIIEDNNIKYINCNDFNNNFNECFEIIKDFIDNSNIHISFDVDSLDPSYMHSTGTRSDDGLNLVFVKKCLDELYNMHENNQIFINNIDITELNLNIGTYNQQYKSLHNILYLFDKYFN
jgi:arginase